MPFLKMPPFTELFNSLPVAPPFQFAGMHTQVFPLQASLYRTQQFLDTYLNMVPAEAGRFRSFLPYVYLMAVDYGSMAGAAISAGWMAQREFMFAVPVEWYVKEGDQWVFKDWAFISPFIFVNNDVALALGRQVWGWPKTYAEVLPTPAQSGHGKEATPILTLATSVYPKVYAGAKMEQRVFLEVHRKPDAAYFSFPPAPGNPFMPWNMWSQVMHGTAEVMSGFAKFMTNRSLDGGAPSGGDPRHLGEMAQVLRGILDPQNLDLYFNTLNLKQFRSATSQTAACYQALTNSRMQVTRFNAAGTLGALGMLAGDVSGGYSIQITQWPSLPIVDMLGLRAVERRPDGDVDVITLKPVAPFWYDVDMTYNLGRNVASRSTDDQWRREGGAPYPEVPAKVDGPPGADVTALPPYNNTLGTYSQAMVGPFLYPSVLARVLPLLAKREVVQSSLDSLFGSLTEADRRIEVWSDCAEHAYVYLVATNYGQVASTTNDIGSWTQEGISFMVPVVFQRLREGMSPDDNEAWEPITVGLVPLAAYTNGSTEAITATEVMGIPTNQAIFDKPPMQWLEQPPLEQKKVQSMLRVSVDLLPGLTTAQKMEKRQLIEILEHDDLPQVESPRRWDEWCTTLREEAVRKTEVGHTTGGTVQALRLLALSPLARARPIHIFTLKQIRDDREIDSACYQSLTMIDQVWTELFDIEESPHRTRVKIDQYPSFPVVEKLGLIPCDVRVRDGNIAYIMEPVRPFTVRYQMKQPLATRLYWRDGVNAWTPAAPEPWAPGLGKKLPGDVEVALGEGDPGDLAQIVSRYLREHGPTLADGTAQDMQVVQAIGPQTVLESILSREWGRTSPGAAWERGAEAARAALDRSLQTVLSRDQTGTIEETLLQVLRDRGNPVAPARGHDRALKQRISRIAARSDFARRLGDLSDAMRAAPREDRDGMTASTEPAPSVSHAVAALKEAREACLSQLASGSRELADVQGAFKIADELTHDDLGAAELPAEGFAALNRRVNELRHTVQVEEALLLNQIGKRWQRPEHFVDRDRGAALARELFPEDESWHGLWFYDPDRKVSDN